MSRNRKMIIFIIAVAAIVLTACTQIAIFVIPPIGAVPEGRTLIISRLNKTKFVDSADAMCERFQGGAASCVAGLCWALLPRSRIYIFGCLTASGSTWSPQAARSMIGRC